MVLVRGSDRDLEISLTLTPVRRLVWLAPRERFAPSLASVALRSDEPDCMSVPDYKSAAPVGNPGTAAIRRGKTSGGYGIAIVRLLLRGR